MAAQSYEYWPKDMWASQIKFMQSLFKYFTWKHSIILKASENMAKNLMKNLINLAG